jgi:hypothetical protein
MGNIKISSSKNRDPLLVSLKTELIFLKAVIKLHIWYLQENNCTAYSSSNVKFQFYLKWLV